MAADSKNVLLIDDDPDMHDAVRMILAPRGYQVRAYLTGPEGLAALRQDHPDLVMLDVMLAAPAEGFELAHEIRSDPMTRHIPIVMVSAIDEQLGREFADQLGSHYERADAFVEKPLEAATLRQVIEQTLAAVEKTS